MKKRMMAMLLIVIILAVGAEASQNIQWVEKRIVSGWGIDIHLFVAPDVAEIFEVKGIETKSFGHLNVAVIRFVSKKDFESLEDMRKSGADLASFKNDRRVEIVTDSDKTAPESSYSLTVKPGTNLAGTVHRWKSEVELQIMMMKGDLPYKIYIR